MNKGRKSRFAVALTLTVTVVMTRRHVHTSIGSISFRTAVDAAWAKAAVFSLFLTIYQASLGLLRQQRCFVFIHQVATYYAVLSIDQSSVVSIIQGSSMAYTEMTENKRNNDEF